MAAGRPAPGDGDDELPLDLAHGDPAGQVELRVAVGRALRLLTPRQRAVLVLRYFEDLPEREVAAILECPVGTVRSLAHRALRRLRELAPELANLESGPDSEPGPGSSPRPGTRSGSGSGLDSEAEVTR